MARTWITDMRHYLDENDDLPPGMPAAAAHLALFQGAIVAWVTSRSASAGESTNVPCHRRAGKPLCTAEVQAWLRPEDAAIAWECPACGDQGVIHGWPGTRWDRRRPQAREHATGSYLRLKVTLRGSKPPIWRRFLVPGSISLKRLHDCLQAVMGWTDSHLHQFEANGVLYGPPDRELGIERVSESKTTVGDVLRRPKDELRYEYDFGDGWEHSVVLEAHVPPREDGRYPILEAGARACPPEDVGGIFGYERFLEVIRNPKHAEHAETLVWAGGSFDPEAFRVDDANPATRGVGCCGVRKHDRGSVGSRPPAANRVTDLRRPAARRAREGAKSPHKG